MSDKDYKKLVATISALELERDRWDLKIEELDYELSHVEQKKQEVEGKLTKLRKELKTRNR